MGSYHAPEQADGGARRHKHVMSHRPDCRVKAKRQAAALDV